MSIELEYALEHKNDPAVLCCRMEAGEISHHNLEDPAIFPDLIDTGLLNVDGAVTIGQAIGATLTKTCDSLTPLTPDILENIQSGEDEPEEAAEEAPAEAAAPVMAVPEGTMVKVGGGVVKLYIAEGKDISIEFPV